MEESTVGHSPPGATPKHFARQLLTIGSNRLELLTVEVQEECEHFLHAFLLALGVAAFGLLGGLTLTAAIVVLLPAYSHVAVLLALTGLYGAAGFGFWRRLAGLRRNRQCLSATLGQLKKDRVCLEKILA
jgi:uncharacterized membrane protein YqjE